MSAQKRPRPPIGVDRVAPTFVQKLAGLRVRVKAVSADIGRVNGRISPTVMRSANDAVEMLSELRMQTRVLQHRLGVWYPSLGSGIKETYHFFVSELSEIREELEALHNTAKRRSDIPEDLRRAIASLYAFTVEIEEVEAAAEQLR